MDLAFEVCVEFSGLLVLQHLYEQDFILFGCMPADGQNDIVCHCLYAVCVRSDQFGCERIEVILLVPESVGKLGNDMLITEPHAGCREMAQTDGTIFGIGSYAVARQ